MSGGDVARVCAWFESQDPRSNVREALSDNPECKYIRIGLDCLETPPIDLLQVQIDQSLSPFEKFVLRFCHLLDDGCILKLIGFVPETRKEIVLSTLLPRLEELNRIQVLEIFPRCDCVFLSWIRLLSKKELFLRMFRMLFYSFDGISLDLLATLDRCFRTCMKNGLGIDNFSELIAFLQRIPAAKDGSSSAPIDFFFSALYDDLTIAVRYCSQVDVECVLSGFDQRSDLPVSFLRFLIVFGVSCDFNPGQLKRYIVTAPSHLFMFMNSQSEEIADRLFKQVLEVVSAAGRHALPPEAHVNVLRAVLHNVIGRKALIPVLLNPRIQTWVYEFLMAKSEGFAPFLATYLVFVRLSNDAVKQFEKMFSVGIGEFLDEAIRTDETVVPGLIWALNPACAFPYPGFAELQSELVLNLISYPVYPFVTRVAPTIVKAIINTKNDVFIESLLESAESIPHCLLMALSEYDNIEPFLENAANNILYRRLITYGLSLSCDPITFAVVYEKIGADLEKMIDLFSELARRSPLVDDYLYVDNRFAINTPIMNGSLCMWVKVHSGSAVILRLRYLKSKVSISWTNDGFSLSVNEKILRQIHNPHSVEGWFFICLQVGDGKFVWSVNLEEQVIQLTYPEKIAVEIGSKESSIEVQSFRVFRPPLTRKQVIHLFALGPNFKDGIVSNFLSFKDAFPTFGSDSGYVSKLMLNWASEIMNTPPESEFTATAETTIRPPFLTKVSNVRRSLSNADFHDQCRSLLTRRIHVTPFLNALDSHGGIYLIIHMWAEVILSYPHLLEKMISFIDVLINRFPIFHHVFVRNSVYCMIGHLLHNTQHNFLGLVYDGKTKLITNAYVLRYFVLGPSLSVANNEAMIDTLINSVNHSSNKLMFSLAHAFTNVVQTVSKSKNHSVEFLETLNHLALRLTDASTAESNIKFVFDHLMINHLVFAKRCSIEDVNPSVAMIHLLDSLLSMFPDVPRPSIELMIPAVLPCGVKTSLALIRLLFRHLDYGNMYALSIVMRSLGSSEILSNGICKLTSDYFAMNPEVFRIHFVTLTLVYLCSHANLSDELFAVCMTAVPYLQHLEDIPAFAYDHLLQAVYLSESSDNEAISLRPEIVTETSWTMSPFCVFVYEFLHRAIELEEHTHFERFFVSLFAFTDVPEYRICMVALFLLGRVLQAQIETNRQTVSHPSVSFAISYGRFVFHRIHLIPGMKSDDFSMIVQFFIQKLLDAVNILDSTDLNENAIRMLNEFANLNSMSETILSTVTSCKALSRHRNFASTIDRLENPTSYVPVKAQPQRFEADLEKYSSIWSQREETDRNGLLSILCKAVLYQNSAANDIILVDENGDKAIQVWHTVFDVLLFPASKLFSHCPLRYKVSEACTKIEHRRILRPINPASDKLYFSFYETKYHEQPPKVRVSLNDVLSTISISFFDSRVIFTGDAARLLGISVRRGLIVVTDDKMKFYQSQNEDMITLNLRTDVEYIMLMNYEHQARGILIFDKQSLCYGFAFEAASLREGFVAAISDLNITIKSEIDKEELQQYQSKWRDGTLSNFNYLMILNHLSGRNWVDFTQFPVMPWTIAQFSEKELDFTNPATFRDLMYPLFAQGEKQREHCHRYFESTCEVEAEGYHFPNFISNVGSTLYYLVRLEPFTDEEISLQGGRFDSPERTFRDFGTTYEVMTIPGAKTALELVPEAYYMPEMLIDLNKVVFRKSSMQDKDITNVTLPPWAKSPPDFVRKMRMALESDYVSQMLSEWIDLIWGARQQGKGALERVNVLQRIVFNFDPVDYQNDYTLMKALSDQIHNCGQSPTRLFSEIHPRRKNKPTSRHFTIHRTSEKRSRADTSWFPLSNGSKVRISSGAIELWMACDTITAFQMSEEIRPVAMHVCGNDLVTGHYIPLVNHWTVTDRGLQNLATLRGHMAQIESLVIHSSCAIIAAGHVDGNISVFRTNPHQFIRVLRCRYPFPVTQIRLSPSVSDIVTVQLNHDQSFLSLWSVNGVLLKETIIDGSVVDCGCTSFDEGTKSNQLFVLTSDGLLSSYSSHSLREKGAKIDMKRRYGQDALISIWNNKVLFVTDSKSLVTFEIRACK